MITDIASDLRFSDSVRRRTERDVAALPPGAAVWRAPAVDGKPGWSIGQIVDHIVGRIGGSRLYFASAYRDEGWIWSEPESDPKDQTTCQFAGHDSRVAACLKAVAPGVIKTG